MEKKIQIILDSGTAITLSKDDFHRLKLFMYEEHKIEDEIAKQKKRSKFVGTCTDGNIGKLVW